MSQEGGDGNMGAGGKKSIAFQWCREPVGRFNDLFHTAASTSPRSCFYLLVSPVLLSGADPVVLDHEAEGLTCRAGSVGRSLGPRGLHEKHPVSPDLT